MEGIDCLMEDTFSLRIKKKHWWFQQSFKWKHIQSYNTYTKAQAHTHKGKKIQFQHKSFHRVFCLVYNHGIICLKISLSNLSLWTSFSTYDIYQLNNRKCCNHIHFCLIDFLWKFKSIFRRHLAEIKHDNSKSCSQ